ncbi:unnamed protein product [Echinostoma caproni]|uniref:Uncharacterized protein n=1 Tax=Echinostoma caproni TaxID=27848 RepID=A0A3P8LC14_9TREM|nr:unnamed protein product [Echinostoma caproni]
MSMIIWLSIWFGNHFVRNCLELSKLQRRSNIGWNIPFRRVRWKINVIVQIRLVRWPPWLASSVTRRYVGAIRAL